MRNPSPDSRGDRRATTRRWSTPLTISAFVLMAGTGVLMFFDYDYGLTAVTHQWFSWVFLIGAAGHIVSNWRPLKIHLQSTWARGAAFALMTVFAASFFPWGLVTGPQLERPIVLSLVDAPLSALADIRNVSPEALVARLGSHGVTATPNETIRQLAERHRIGANRLLGIVFDVG